MTGQLCGASPHGRLGCPSARRSAARAAPGAPASRHRGRVHAVCCDRSRARIPRPPAPGAAQRLRPRQRRGRGAPRRPRSAALKRPRRQRHHAAAPPCCTHQARSPTPAGASVAAMPAPRADPTSSLPRIGALGLRAQPKPRRPPARHPRGHRPPARRRKRPGSLTRPRSRPWPGSRRPRRPPARRWRYGSAGRRPRCSRSRPRTPSLLSWYCRSPVAPCLQQHLSGARMPARPARSHAEIGRRRGRRGARPRGSTAPGYPPAPRPARLLELRAGRSETPSLPGPHGAKPRSPQTARAPP